MKYESKQYVHAKIKNSIILVVLGRLFSSEWAFSKCPFSDLVSSGSASFSRLPFEDISSVQKAFMNCPVRIRSTADAASHKQRCKTLSEFRRVGEDRCKQGRPVCGVLGEGLRFLVFRGRHENSSRLAWQLAKQHLIPGHPIQNEHSCPTPPLCSVAPQSWAIYDIIEVIFLTWG